MPQKLKEEFGEFELLSVRVPGTWKRHMVQIAKKTGMSLTDLVKTSIIAHIPGIDGQTYRLQKIRDAAEPYTVAQE